MGDPKYIAGRRSFTGTKGKAQTISKKYEHAQLYIFTYLEQ